MPLQMLVAEAAMARIGRPPSGRARRRGARHYFVGQVVGQLDQVKPAAEVVYEMVRSSPTSATAHRPDPRLPCRTASPGRLDHRPGRVGGLSRAHGTPASRRPLEARGGGAMLAALTGLGLSTAAGLNAYIPLLVVGILANLTDRVRLPRATTGCPTAGCSPSSRCCSLAESCSTRSRSSTTSTT